MALTLSRPSRAAADHYPDERRGPGTPGLRHHRAQEGGSRAAPTKTTRRCGSGAGAVPAGGLTGYVAVEGHDVAVHALGQAVAAVIGPAMPLVIDKPDALVRDIRAGNTRKPFNKRLRAAVVELLFDNRWGHQAPACDRGQLAARLRPALPASADPAASGCLRI